MIFYLSKNSKDILKNIKFELQVLFSHGDHVEQFRSTTWTPKMKILIRSTDQSALCSTIASLMNISTLEAEDFSSISPLYQKNIKE